ncbi:12246_t:CDS:2 [Entrophospora sp. SA101]|nr:12246_t:CDS:2 [Entrophospora sp. SA101]
MSDRYSFSLTTFSPSGKLVQIEYALNAVAQGVTSIGIKATNGVVVATEKKTASPLIDDSSLEKVANVCPNIGIVYSGMGPDFRVLLTKARKAAQKYKRIYNEYPPTGILVKEVASVMQEFTQSGYNDDIGLEDAVHTSILTLKEGFEGQMTENSIEIGIIGGDTTGFMEGKEQPLFRKLSPSEVKSKDKQMI